VQGNIVCLSRQIISNSLSFKHYEIVGQSMEKLQNYKSDGISLVYQYPLLETAERATVVQDVFQGGQQVLRFEFRVRKSAPTAAKL